MTHPLEIEIKLSASPAMLEQLRTHPQLAGTDHHASLVTTYFDTADGRLRQAGASLRIREGGTQREQTFKLTGRSGSSIRRMEWNRPVAEDRPEPTCLPVKARSMLARLLNGAYLEPVATTRIERTVRRLQFGKSTIEIDFDIGTIRAGGRVEDVCELELELVRGHASDLAALALRLPLGPELGWSVASKAKRCHALALDLPPRAVRATSVGLLASMDVARAFQAIAWNCLGHLLENYPVVVRLGDHEAIHQARVAIRRLRAAFSVFDEVVDDAVAPIMRAELKAIAQGLGPARDLHVLHAGVEAAARTSGQDLGELLHHLGQRRDIAVRSAQEFLGAQAFQRFLFELAVWIEGGPWLAARDMNGGSDPILPFATRALSRRRRKLRRIDVPVADLSDTQRHRLRIDVKKLRYATGFFSSLFRGKAVATRRTGIARALTRLQESLGELNDMANASGRHDILFAGLEPICAARLSTQLEEVLESRAHSRGKLLKIAERSLAELDNASPWWKDKP